MGAIPVCATFSNLKQYKTACQTQRLEENREAEKVRERERERERERLVLWEREAVCKQDILGRSDANWNKIIEASLV